MTAPGPRIVVIGMGNILCSDDGIGVHAAERLAADPRLPAGVEVVDGGTLGLDLLGYVTGAGRLLVLDAVDAGVSPGTVTRLGRDDLLGMLGASDAHRVAITDLLNAAALLGAEPEDVVLLGVQPENTTLGATLSFPVAAALDALVEAALRQVVAWVADDR